VSIYSLVLCLLLRLKLLKHQCRQLRCIYSHQYATKICSTKIEESREFQNRIVTPSPSASISSTTSRSLFRAFFASTFPGTETLRFCACFCLRPLPPLSRPTSLLPRQYPHNSSSSPCPPPLTESIGEVLFRCSALNKLKFSLRRRVRLAKAISTALTSLVFSSSFFFRSICRAHQVATECNQGLRERYRHDD
jgi:hypothetical protein